MKANVQNMISNVNEMQDLDSKSSRIKDVSLEFKKNSIELEQKAKWIAEDQMMKETQDLLYAPDWISCIFPDDAV